MINGIYFHLLFIKSNIEFDNNSINLVGKYLKENDIDGEIEINFAPGLACSGRINHYGMENNDPSTRKFVVWINNDKGNHFLREDGIVCLCDHEIGTHYYRSFNDGYLSTT